jgi:hypothetical protein
MLRNENKIQEFKPEKHNVKIQTNTSNFESKEQQLINKQLQQIEMQTNYYFIKKSKLYFKSYWYNCSQDFGRFELIYFVRNIEYGKLEMILKNHELLKPNLITLIINNVKYNELFELDDNVTIKKLKNILLKESRKLEMIQLFKLQKQLLNNDYSSELD